MKPFLCKLSWVKHASLMTTHPKQDTLTGALDFHNNFFWISKVFYSSGTKMVLEQLRISPNKYKKVQILIYPTKSTAITPKI